MSDNTHLCWNSSGSCACCRRVITTKSDERLDDIRTALRWALGAKCPADVEEAVATACKYVEDYCDMQTNLTHLLSQLAQGDKARNNIEKILKGDYDKDD